jgi:hypothetical protein
MPVTELNGSPAHLTRLATHAELLAAWLHRPADRLPPRWRTPGFAHSVDLVRAHLRPIRSRESLARSYGREHFQVVSVGDPPPPPVLLARNATEVAYAMRWLELADDRESVDWIALVGPPG